jgi:anti-sigma B factor antagonist
MASFAEPQFELFEDEVDERTHVIAVSGEIHVSTAPEFSTRLNDAIGQGKTSVVLDLADVSFIDSTGLSVLLNGLRRVTRRGGRMAIVCTNPTVLRLFEITRLDTTFEIVDSREAAVAAVRRAGEAQDGRGELSSSDGAP